MTNKANFMRQRERTVGDVAVDGLLAGLAAGLVMGVLLVLLGLLEGAGPLETLGRFDPANGGSPVTGGLLHLAVSGIYGAIFAVIYRFVSSRWTKAGQHSRLFGAAYGLALWMAAQFVLLPGLASTLTAMSPLVFALGHLAYGIGLGYWIGRHAGD